MTKRFYTGLVAVAVVAACGPSIPDSNPPDSGQGVGFGNYEEYQRKQAERDAALARGVALPPANAVSSETLPSAGATATTTTSGSVASDTIAALDATDQARADANSGVLPVEADPGRVATNAAGISEENDFNAVGEQRSIEGDAAKIAANRAQYQVIEPEALPTRSGSGPNIVAYALAAKHPVGTQVYSRINIASGNRYAKNCAKYPSPDKAQEDFLSSGGPDRDRKGLDPDGDGYACAWNPAPFRKAVGG